MTNFYSHAPRGARPLAASISMHLSRFLLTRPSRGATICIGTFLFFSHISTHTPLAGRDSCVRSGRRPEQFLLTRPSRGATVCEVPDRLPVLFLLTRPSRGATLVLQRIHSFGVFLLTRPSRGATLAEPVFQFILIISTHTPLAGRDRNILNISCDRTQFIVRSGI